MKISANSVVSLDYALHLGDGKVIDASETEPLTYLHGGGQIIPGLERQLEGLEKGDSRKLTVAPADGYGEYDPEQLQEVPKSAFGDHELQAGERFVAVDDHQHQMEVRIVKVEGDKVTVDFNHELAGKTLHFDITVRDVREATEEELAHGHAHGPHAHHH